MEDNYFFWLGDPDNRFQTIDEYNEALLAFREYKERDENE